MNTTLLTHYGTLFETVPEACMVEFLREAGFFLFNMNDHIPRGTPNLN